MDDFKNSQPSGTGCGVVDDTSSAEQTQFLSDVLDGLSGDVKHLHCKYLYDQRGSELFDQICDLDEYYPTRTESSITCQNAAEIAQCIGPNATVVEYGSGSSTKTRVLLDHLEDASAYLPVDISAEHLQRTALQLQEEYPDLDISPIVADFTQAFELPQQYDSSGVVVYFPGSTIGNLLPDDAIALLENVSQLCGPEGSLLIGFDLQKETVILERAYNDCQGVTAEFNLNLLQRINRELEGDFDLQQFAHLAMYNQSKARVEIYIESLCEQTVNIDDQEIDFESGQRILTEYSHKYTIEGFAEMASSAGLEMNRVWTDEKDYFAVMHLRAT